MKIALLFLAVFTTQTFGAGSITNDNAVNVFLRTDCTEQVGNCVTTMSEMLDWIWGYNGNPSPRNPTASNPLIVDVGTGTFEVPNTGNKLFCDGQGNVTFRGSGIDNTVLIGGGIFPGWPLAGLPVIAIRDCVRLTFQDMTIRSGTWTGSESSHWGVLWLGGGNSTWTNINVEAGGYGWYDHCALSSGSRGVHYWFGSKIATRVYLGDTFPYVSACGDNWFYGGELQALVDGSLLNGAAGAAATTSDGSLQIFGSSVRVLSTPDSVSNASSLFGYNGLLSFNGGSLHMHGGIIAVRADKAVVNQDVFGANALDSISIIHTPATAWTVKAGGTGTATRVSGSGAVAPLLIGPSSDIPRSTSASGSAPMASTTGSDIFVETDCGQSGNCDSTAPANQVPHLMVYSANCNTAGPWFNVVTGKCRGVITP